MLLPRVFKPFQTSKYWYCLSQNRLFCNGLWSVLNGTIYCLEDLYPKSKICRIGPTAAIPVGKRLPRSRMVVQLHRVPSCLCAALQLGFGKVICLHHGDDIYFCWKYLICYFQAGIRRKGRRMGFCRVIFPTWGCVEGLLKEKKLWFAFMLLPCCSLCLRVLLTCWEIGRKRWWGFPPPVWLFCTSQILSCQ